MFDKVKFLQVSSILKSFKGNLPKGRIPVIHVNDYHSQLSELQDQIGVNLEKFRIPKEALTPVAIGSVSFDDWGNAVGNPPVEYFCDPDVFRRQLDATLIFIESYFQDLQAELKDKQN